MTEDYKKGYQEGFAAGWNAAKESTVVPYMPQSVPKDYKFIQGCPLCGIGKNGEPLGVACQHPQCPTRFYSGVISGGVALCDTSANTFAFLAGNVTFNNNMTSTDLNNDK